MFEYPLMLNPLLMTFHHYATSVSRAMLRNALPTNMVHMYTARFEFGANANQIWTESLGRNAIRIEPN